MLTRLRTQSRSGKIAFVILSHTLFGCAAKSARVGQNPDSSDISTVVSGFVDPTTLDPVPCDSGGFPLTMHLSAEGVTATAKDTQLQLGEQGLDTSDFVEFQICGNPDGTAVLKKILLIRRMSAGAWLRSVDALIPEDDSHKTVLGEAIGSGDYSKIDIQFLNKEENAPSYLMKGWKRQDGSSFVTISAFDVKSGAPLKVMRESERTSQNFRGFNSAVFGVLKDGGARDFDAECKKNTRTKRFSADKLDIKLKFCYTGNHAVYINYKFHELTILDKNSDESIEVSGNDEIEKILTVKNSHHSLTDEFQINTQKSSYVIAPYKFSYSYRAPGLKGAEIKLDCSRVYNCGEDVMENTGPQPM